MMSDRPVKKRAVNLFVDAELLAAIDFVFTSF